MGLTLDYLATNSVEIPVMTALREAFLGKFREQHQKQFAVQYCLAHILKATTNASPPLAETLAVQAPELMGFLRHSPMRQILAVEAIAGDLDAGAKCQYLETQLPLTMVQLLAERLCLLPRKPLRGQKRFSNATDAYFAFDGHQHQPPS